jgi:hypothetical protein
VSHVLNAEVAERLGKNLARRENLDFKLRKDPSLESIKTLFSNRSNDSTKKR